MRVPYFVLFFEVEGGLGGHGAPGFHLVRVVGLLASRVAALVDSVSVAAFGGEVGVHWVGEFG